MVDVIIGSIVECIASVIEKGLLGIFGLFEIVNSENVNEKYAIVLVALFTLSVATLWYLSKDRVSVLLNKKRRKRKKSKVASRQVKPSMAKKSPSKQSSSKSKSSKNKTTVKMDKKGATKINVKKEIVTPGVRKSRKKAV